MIKIYEFFSIIEKETKNKLSHCNRNYQAGEWKHGFII